MPAALSSLHAEIDARVSAIRNERQDWPCGKGCDTCCQQLAEVPQLTAPEWELLRAGLAALPAARRESIARAIRELAAAESTRAAAGIRERRRVACPLLDTESGACPVYAQRPVACRSYGFYVQRELGLYCADIEQRVAGGDFADVVWGNHDAIDSRLARMGESRPLTEWFADYGIASPA
nr:YkgJ family cysteine cluster protein [Rhodocyclus purpureus]